METLRFLMVTTFYPPFHIGGDAVHVQDLARALTARGHEVHVEFSPAAYALKRGATPTAPRAAEDNGVQLHAIPGDGWALPVAAHVLGRCRPVGRFHARIRAEIRPDVVHYHNISLLGLQVEPCPGALSLYTAHDYWVRCPRSDLFKYGRYPCEAPACIRCAIASRRPPQLWRFGWPGLPGVDCAIAPSRFMARAIRPALRCPVVHIPNFVPDAGTRAIPDGPGSYYLFVGVLEPHKGVPELVAAWRRRPFPLRIVGRGSLDGTLGRIVPGTETGPRLEGWVPRDRLARYYQGAKALVVPSLSWENAPLVALEALSFGTPLLVSRRGGLVELLHDGAAGLSFEPQPDGILDAIGRFEGAGDTRGLRRGAREAYEAYHSPEAYLEPYLELASGGPPEGPSPAPMAAPGIGVQGGADP